jgi:hypothetical protein
VEHPVATTAATSNVTRRLAVITLVLLSPLLRTFARSVVVALSRVVDPWSLLVEQR